MPNAINFTFIIRLLLWLTTHSSNVWKWLICMFFTIVKWNGSVNMYCMLIYPLNITNPSFCIVAVVQCWAGQVVHSCAQSKDTSILSYMLIQASRLWNAKGWTCDSIRELWHLIKFTFIHSLFCSHLFLISPPYPICPSLTSFSFPTPCLSPPSCWVGMIGLVSVPASVPSHVKVHSGVRPIAQPVRCVLCLRAQESEACNGGELLREAVTELITLSERQGLS